MVCMEFPLRGPSLWDYCLGAMKKLQIIFMLSAAAGIFFSTSCSTTKGFGQDLQKVGNRLENRAEATGGTQ